MNEDTGVPTTPGRTSGLSLIALCLGLLSLPALSLALPLGSVAWYVGNRAQVLALSTPDASPRDLTYARIGRTLGKITTVIWVLLVILGVIAYFILRRKPH
jgi:uncharacterized membrane protein YozB (DUF420 family)